VFSADWCKYCNILKNDIADNLDEFNNYIICYADYDENRDIVKEYRVRTIPHSIILVNKTEKSTKVGYKNIKDYVNWKNNATK
jgi:thiol-disulfide isomerase/thioredoxin